MSGNLRNRRIKTLDYLVWKRVALVDKLISDWQWCKRSSLVSDWLRDLWLFFAFDWTKLDHFYVIGIKERTVGSNYYCHAWNNCEKWILLWLEISPFLSKWVTCRISRMLFVTKTSESPVALGAKTHCINLSRLRLGWPVLKRRFLTGRRVPW